VARLLDPKRPEDSNQKGIPSRAAARDRSKALHKLRGQTKWGERGDVYSKFTEKADPEGLPTIGWGRRMFHSVTTVVTTPAEKLPGTLIDRIAIVFTGRPRTEADAQLVDPDPWGTPHNLADHTNKKPSDADKAFFATLLGVYSAQYGSYTTLLWQVPALSLTAQAFLLTIALGPNNKWSKIIASVLSIVIALASTRLMHDQRGHAINHGELALRVSRTLGLAKQFGDLNVDDAKPTRANAETLWVGWDRRIYTAWKIALYLFLAADLAVIGLVIFKVPGF
jgi:hypothetical protein